ncbi:MAG: BON domain-containing protein [Acidobacteriota bacterium]|nr:BON domain-containing protein [Acidobacteriota bacterium]
MKNRISVSPVLLFLLVILGVAFGCNKTPNDSAIAADIQTKLGADSGLQDKQITVHSVHGAVTLTGNVDNNTQRDTAARYASAVPGVGQVVNNLQISPTAVPPPDQMAVEPEAQQPPPESDRPTPAKRERPRRREKSSASSYADERRSSQNRSSQDNVAQNQSQASTSSTPSNPSASNVTPALTPAATPAPPPPPRKVTIPSGTQLAIRLVDSIDTQTSQSGQTFHATLDSPISIDGETVVPAGYDVEGHIANLQSAGKFSGKSVLQLQLDRMKVGDRYYNIQTDQFSREGSARGKNTAEKVGGGALIGALIGGLAGGGKGAGIGAAAGAGVGGGVQAASKSQQVKLGSETVLTFHLQAPVTVTQTSKGPHEGRQQLDIPNQP